MNLLDLPLAGRVPAIARRGIEVAGVGVTTHLATTLTDAAGRPTTSAMLWRDNRPGRTPRNSGRPGRRLPGWDIRQRGRVEGLSAEYGPAHLMRAAEEGSIFEVRLGIGALRGGGTTVSQVILAGQPATSARATQLRANAWGIQVGRDSDEYASLRGAALAASVAAAYFPDARSAAAALVGPPEWNQPEPGGTDVAGERYQRWRALMGGFLRQAVTLYG